MNPALSTSDAIEVWLRRMVWMAVAFGTPWALFLAWSLIEGDDRLGFAIYFALFAVGWAVYLGLIRRALGRTPWKDSTALWWACLGVSALWLILLPWVGVTWPPTLESLLFLVSPFGSLVVAWLGLRLERLRSAPARQSGSDQAVPRRGTSGPSGARVLVTKRTTRIAWAMGVVAATFGAAFLGEPIRLSNQPEGPMIWSERRVCAAWLPTGDPYDHVMEVAGSPRRFRGIAREPWVAVTPGTRLYHEIKSAKRVVFELDPGSGLGEACVGRELQFRDERSNVVRALLDQCGLAIKVWSLRGARRDQIALAVRSRSSGDARCDVSQREPLVQEFESGGP